MNAPKKKTNDVGSQHYHGFSQLQSEKIFHLLGDDVGARYMQPYEHAAMRIYDRAHREKKRAQARLIHEFTLVAKKQDLPLRDFVKRIFDDGIDPSMLTVEKRVLLVKRIAGFLRARARLTRIVDDHPEPYDLLKAIFSWLKRPRFVGEISYVLDGMGLAIYCEKEADYLTIVSQGYQSYKKIYHNTVALTELPTNPSEISPFVKVFQKKQSNKTALILVHENQHLINAVFMEQIVNPYERAHDEIIAQLKDGSSRSQILYSITDKTSCYNHFLNEKGMPYKPKTYRKDFARYFALIYKATEIAEQLKIHKVPYYLELLIATPIHDRPKLRQYLRHAKQQYLPVL